MAAEAVDRLMGYRKPQKRIVSLWVAVRLSVSPPSVNTCHHEPPARLTSGNFTGRAGASGDTARRNASELAGSPAAGAATYAKLIQVLAGSGRPKPREREPLALPLPYLDVLLRCVDRGLQLVDELLRGGFRGLFSEEY